MSHILMNGFDPRTCTHYDSDMHNPLMKEYKEQTGWDPIGTILTETKEDVCPTSYGETNPEEDLAESAMLYLYDPEELKKKSPKRYSFLKKLFENSQEPARK